MLHPTREMVMNFVDTRDVSMQRPDWGPGQPRRRFGNVTAPSGSPFWMPCSVLFNGSLVSCFEFIHITFLVILCA